MLNPTHTSTSTMPYSVAQLATEIKQLLEMSYRDIWVEGEVSGLMTARSGHSYFSLKDQSSALKCVLFKGKKYLAATLPADGDRILIRGRVSVYTARGDVQMICSYIEAAGEGQLRRQFELLKQKLASEGLFDAERKQALPPVAHDIALITSPSGAVLHDIISTLQRRYPFVRLRVYPANVQGAQAQQEILEALELAIKNAPDVVILARGGGSLEDLQVFNDEAIARAIANCMIPTISAIGHETDFVISDFVADVRAPTPTAAATLVTPDVSETRQALQQSQSSLDYRIRQFLNNAQQRIDFAVQGLAHPKQRIELQSGELKRLILRLDAAQQNKLKNHSDTLNRLNIRLHGIAPGSQLQKNQYTLLALRERLAHAMNRNLTQQQATLENSNARLEALSPLKTLGRGYAILQNQHGEIIDSSTQIAKGETLQARLHQGKLSAVVSAVELPENP